MKRTLNQAKEYPKFVVDEVSEKGLTGVRNSVSVPVFTLAKNLSKVLDTHFQVGKPIWEEDWDVLIVLDACRVDLMRSVCDEYEFLPSSQELDTIWSVGSMSNDWIKRTFNAEYEDKVARSAYVTGNCFTGKSTIKCEPKILDEVWTYAWDDELSTVPARPITDRAIDTWRSDASRLDRMIVHYMQPHVPFINNPELGSYGKPEDFGEGFADIWNRVGDDLDYETTWEAYKDNLRYVLDDVSLLLNNLEASSVIITSDHGNAMGEWNLYGHPPGSLHSSIRQVPWIETTSSSTGTYSPGTDRINQNTDENIDERLSALGYK